MWNLEVPINEEKKVIQSYVTSWELEHGTAYVRINPFKSRIKLLGVERGRSAAHFLIELDEVIPLEYWWLEGYKATLFMTDLFSMLTQDQCLFMAGVSPIFTLAPVKRGQNYGIGLAKP